MKLIGKRKGHSTMRCVNIISSDFIVFLDLSIDVRFTIFRKSFYEQYRFSSPFRSFQFFQRISLLSRNLSNALDTDDKVFNNL